MKKWLMIVLTMTMVGAMLTGCAAKEEGADAGATTAGADSGAGEDGSGE
ncbi:MAG: hypothetical protein R2688_06450 [Fimbriimonadaceae bacterium]